jgi:predicted nucleotidyltransferase
MVPLPLEIPREAIAAFCVRNHIRKLSLFGSILSPRFRDESDIDMLVEFKSGRGPGLLGVAGMEIELSAMLGRKVDLRTPGDLSRYRTSPSGVPAPDIPFRGAGQALSFAQNRSGADLNHNTVHLR